METKTSENKLLKINAILLMICAVLGVVVMWFTSINAISPELVADPEVVAKAAVSLGVSPDEMIAMMQTEEGVANVSALLMGLRLAMVAMAVVAAIPRLIAGILGFSRSAKPDKNSFFLVWGVVLLTLGIIGLVFTGGLASLNGVVSVLGGLIAPICYIVGALQQKRLYIEQKSDDPIVRELKYPAADEVSESDES